MSDGDLGTPFRQRAGSAMKDAFLQEALTIATTKFIGLRREAFEGFPEGEALRDRARAIKEATLHKAALWRALRKCGSLLNLNDATRCGCSLCLFVSVRKSPGPAKVGSPSMELGIN